MSFKRVFISYAHEDADLVDLLDGQLKIFSDLEVFVDRNRLQSGTKFTEEISSWIQRADVAILVVSTHFLTSEYVQNIELPALRARLDRLPWLLAQACNWQENEQLAETVALHEIGDESDGALGNLRRAELTTAVSRIARKIADLARSTRTDTRDDRSARSVAPDPSHPEPEPRQTASSSSGSERLREHAHTREALRSEIVEALTHDVGYEARKPIALVGPGGIGKSELAAGVADDPTVRQTFEDGVHSIYVGSDADLTELTQEVLKHLGMERQVAGESDAYRVLRSVVDSRNALFVFDDVLVGATARVLSLRGKSSRIIFTGREAEVFTDSAEVIAVPPLSEGDILAMLSADGRPAPSDHDLQTIVAATAGRLHHLHLVIRNFDSTWNWTETARGLERAAPIGDVSEPALLSPLRLAFERLSPLDQERFARLSIFPRSHRITLDQARRAWRPDDAPTEATIDALERAALIERDGDGLRLPKTNHEFASNQLELAALAHRHFLNSEPGADRLGFDWSALDPDDSYLQDNVVRHLVGANDRGALMSLARNVRWLAMRIRARGAVVAAGDLALIAQFVDSSAIGKLADGVRQRSDIFLGLPDEGSVRATLAYLLADECAECDIEDFGDEANLLRSLVAPPRPSRLLMHTYSGEWDTVVGAEVVPGSGLAAIASGDGAVRLWRMQDVRLYAELQPDSAEVTALAVSRKVIAVGATAGGNHRVVVWDIGRQAPVPTRAMVHDRRITCLAFDPTGRRIASASAGGSVKLWDARTGRAELPPLQLRPTGADRRSGAVRNVTARACRFNADGSLLAVAGSDGRVRLWDTATGIVEREFAASTTALNALDVSPDGSRLVTADAAGDVRVWHLPAGTDVASAAAGGTAVLCCRFSPDGHLIATGGETGVQLWRATGLVPAHDFILGQTGAVSSCTFSDDSGFLITGALDGKVRVWDLSKLDDAPRSGFLHAGQLMDCDIVPTGEIILAARSSGEVEMLEGRAERIIDSLEFSDEPLAACAHAPLEQAVMTLTDRGVIRHMELETKVVTEVASCAPEVADPVRTSIIRDHVSFSPTGDCVAVVGAEPLTMLDRVGGRWVKQNLPRTWAADHGKARRGSTCVAFVGDGSILAIGYEDGRVALVRRDDGRELASAPAGDDGIVACVFDRASGELVTACRDGNVVVWDAVDLEHRHRICSEHQGGLTALAMSNRYIYTVGVDGLLRLTVRPGTEHQVVSGATDLLSSGVTLGLGEPAVAVSCNPPLVVATTRLHVHRFLEI